MQVAGIVGRRRARAGSGQQNLRRQIRPLGEIRPRQRLLQIKLN
jgi:hypothetical protein